MTPSRPTPPSKRRLPALRIALWVMVALVAGLLVLVVAFGQRETAPVRAEASPYGAPFQLVDQNGTPVTEALLRGRPTALFFGFTHCPDVCPTTLYELAGYQRKLKSENRDLQVVFVSVDPERDTPEILRTYVGSLGAEVTAITGEPAPVAAMLKAFGVLARKVPQDDGYTMDHTASVLLLDRTGAFKGTIAYGENPDTALAKLERLAAS